MLGSLAAISLGAGVSAAQNLTPHFNLGLYRAAENQAAAESFSHGSRSLQPGPSDDGVARPEVARDPIRNGNGTTGLDSNTNHRGW
jgi:hypothetical protein